MCTSVDSVASTVNGGKDTVLSQNVYGECMGLTLVRNVFVKFLIFSADHPDYLMLFRLFVSRKASGKGRAVLEGLGHRAETIEACFNSHPLDEEGAVQAGLTKWSSGQSRKPPTWLVLLKAMEYAGIADEHVQGLKKELHLGMLLTLVSGMHVYACDYYISIYNIQAGILLLTGIPQLKQDHHLYLPTCCVCTFVCVHTHTLHLFPLPLVPPIHVTHVCPAGEQTN